MAKSEYQRLPRAGFIGWFSTVTASPSSVWLGSDHVLLVRSNGYAETYKRFYFRDIQAFVLQETRAFSIFNFIFLVPLILTVVIAIAVGTLGWKIFWFLVAGIFGVSFIINLLRGKTCRCYLRTAVQIEHLGSLNRVRKAQLTIARLRPLISVAQGGELSYETISQLMREPVEAPVAAAVTENPDNPYMPPKADA